MDQISYLFGECEEWDRSSLLVFLTQLWDQSLKVYVYQGFMVVLVKRFVNFSVMVQSDLQTQ